MIHEGPVLPGWCPIFICDWVVENGALKAQSPAAFSKEVIFLSYGVSACSTSPPNAKFCYLKHSLGPNFIQLTAFVALFNQ